MHGAHGAFPVALVCGAFAVGHAVKGTRLAQPVAWTTAVALIWLKEKWYRALTFEKVLGGGFARLDDFQGLHPWRLSFNLAVLRIVSFNIDLHWAEGAERERQRVKRTAGAAAAAAAPSTADNDDDQVGCSSPAGSRCCQEDEAFSNRFVSSSPTRGQKSVRGVSAPLLPP